MPRIQVYKSDGKLIPVETAKKATAFQCPWTGKIFSAKASYVQHLKKLRQERNLRRKAISRRHALLSDLNNQLGFDAIIRWVELHPEFFFNNMIQRDPHLKKETIEEIRNNWGVNITFLDLNYSDHIGNTHHCPRSGVTNWNKQRILPNGSPAPTGYPGWHGRIEFQTTHDELSWGSDLFKGTGIHIGSGGRSSASNRYGYSVIFFEDDWPGLQKLRAWSAIGGPDMNKFLRGERRYFSW